MKGAGSKKLTQRSTVEKGTGPLHLRHTDLVQAAHKAKL